MTEKTAFQAYLELQQELAPIGKDAKAYNYKYATLGNVKESVDPILFKHGFFVKQLTTGVPTLVTHLVYVPEGKNFIESVWELKPVKNDPQGMGSALTYGRRYQYMVVCNLVAEDDDGLSASTTPEKPSTSYPAKPNEGKVLIGTVKKEGKNKGRKYEYEITNGKSTFLKWVPEEAEIDELHADNMGADKWEGGL